MKTSCTILSVAAAAMLACAPQAAAPKHADRQFFEKAAKAGMKEVTRDEAGRAGGRLQINVRSC